MAFKALARGLGAGRNAWLKVLFDHAPPRPLAPRIRYNVHDEGGIHDYGRVATILRGLGTNLSELGREDDAAGPRGPLPWVQSVQLPFLWIYRRRDATISVMGTNIYPEDIETLIYREPRLSAAAHSFSLSVVTDASATPRPGIALELNAGFRADPAWLDRLAGQFQAGLAGLNLDFRAALTEFPAAMAPIVEVYELGQGPFRFDAGRIKQRRIIA